MRTQLNSKMLTDAGPEEDLLLDDDSDEPNAAPPGSRQVLRRSERVTKLAVRAACVRFSPDGRSWAAASTEVRVRLRVRVRARANPNPHRAGHLESQLG